MHIFVDESGVFKRNENRPHSISCVAALLIPSRHLSTVESCFSALIKNWPKEENGEIKGRALGEEHLFQLCYLLHHYSAILNISTLDMNMSSDAEVDKHKKNQAHGLIANLTDEHHPNLVRGVYRDKLRLEKMPTQLYAQAVAMTDAMWGAFELSMIYYCQRLPGELGKFIWTIDAKNPEGVTDYEDWWHLNVKGLIQSRSIRKPTPILKGGDYSAFRRNFPKTKTPEFLKPHVPKNQHKDTMDLNAILREINFLDSSGNIGLQIVDILANGFRRALSGRMRRDGWIGLEKLLIHSNKGAIVINTFGKGGRLKASYTDIVKELNKGGRSMLKTK